MAIVATNQNSRVIIGDTADLTTVAAPTTPGLQLGDRFHARDGATGARVFELVSVSGVLTWVALG